MHYFLLFYRIVQWCLVLRLKIGNKNRTKYRCSNGVRRIERVRKTQQFIIKFNCHSMYNNWMWFFFAFARWESVFYGMMVQEQYFIFEDAAEKERERERDPKRKKKPYLVIVADIGLFDSTWYQSSENDFHCSMFFFLSLLLHFILLFICFVWRSISYCFAFVVQIIKRQMFCLSVVLSFLLLALLFVLFVFFPFFYFKKKHTHFFIHFDGWRYHVFFLQYTNK